MTIAVAAILVALGWRTRAASAVFLVGFVWLELVEVTTYLNHYWFASLLGIVLLALPSGARWSLDTRRAGPRPVLLAARSGWSARGRGRLRLRGAGQAPPPTGSCTANPSGVWLPARSDLAIIGPWLDEPWLAHGLSWAGAAFDLLIVPALCWKRTRPYAWCLIVVFHVVTWRLFPIGVFPWLMIAVSTVFFAPDWPARLRRSWSRNPAADRATAEVVPTVSGAPARRLPTLVVVGAVVWVAVQVVLPLRHWIVPGDYRWTNEGYRFAWVVLLTEKGGDVTFRVREPTTGRRCDRDRTGPLHAEPVAGDDDRTRVDPSGRPCRRRTTGRPWP